MHVRDEVDARSLTRHVHCGLGLLEVDFPAVETGGRGDEHACPAECESHVCMEVYLLEQVRTRQILLRLNGRWPGYGGARTRFRASSQAFLRSVAFALLTWLFRGGGAAATRA